MSIPHSPENGKGSLRFVCGTPDMLSASSSIPAARGARNRPSCPPQPPASSVLSLGAAARPALPPTGLSRRKSLKAEAFLFGDPVPRDAVRSLPAGRRNVVHSHSFRRKAGPCFDGRTKTCRSTRLLSFLKILLERLLLRRSPRTLWGTHLRPSAVTPQTRQLRAPLVA